MHPDATTRRLFAAPLATALLLTLFASAHARQPAVSKSVLVLYWYNKDYPGNVLFDQSFRAVLQSAPAETVEYYPEYLESNRFPGENQSLLLHDYLRQKYADINIDVVVASGYVTQDFLLKYRNDLFTHAPIVFVGVKRPTAAELAAGPGITGIICYDTYRKTLDLALRLHPDTNQVFVISGTLEHDKVFETLAREQLRSYENRLRITYLTDFSPNELIAKTKSLPERSIILYVWQQSPSEQGKVLESADILTLIAQSASAPIYGLSGRNVGVGAVGGYVFTLEGNGAKAAEIALRIANGERAQDIPVESAPNVPMFDWRQLRRFHINEDLLPPGSVVRFKELTFWGQYKWYVAGVLSLCAVEALLIAVLLIERRRRQRAKAALDRLNVELEGRVSDRTSALAAKTRELESFAYTVAHDLKAPLRGIEGYSRLLLKNYTGKLDEEGQILLRTICSSSDRMSELIKDLLAYSRLEHLASVPSRLELRPFFEKLVEEKLNEIKARGIELTMNVNGGSVTADAEGLTQALRNYLDNAIKFTRDTSHPSIELGANEGDGGCRLWVRDNGVGFDMKHHERVFEIFHRLHRAEDYPGTGVGLAIARKAAERMGGRAWAESEPGHGSTFYLELPEEYRAPAQNLLLESNTSPN
jgi:signal transduction histidine kinase